MVPAPVSGLRFPPRCSLGPGQVRLGAGAHGWLAGLSRPHRQTAPRQLRGRAPGRGCVRPRGMQLSAEVAKGMPQPDVSTEPRNSFHFLEVR